MQCWALSFVDVSCFAREFLGNVDDRRQRSFVRPLFAVHLTAGLDEVRMPGPDQTGELGSSDSISGYPGSGSA